MARARIPENLFEKGISRKDFLKAGGVGVAGVSMLGLSGCGSVFGGGGGEGEGGGNGGGQGGAGGNTLNFNLGAEIPDMDPSTSTDANSSDVMNNIYDTLYRLDNDLVPQPAIAESYETSNDDLTYTFTIKDDVVWSNGEPVTAGDFRYAWLRAMSPDTASQYAFILADYIEGGTEYSAGEGSEEDVGLEAPDDTTLVVDLSRPTPYFLSLTTFKTYIPLKQSFIEEQGDGFAQSADSMLYNGPYVLTQYNPTNGATLQKNEDYWNADAVMIPNINLEVVTDQQTALNLYQSGELDFAGLTAENIDRYEGDPQLYSYTEFASWYLTYNYEDETMTNQSIRQAISQGVDKDALVNQILKNGSESGTGLVPPGMAGSSAEEPFRETFGAQAPEFDAEAARQAWEAGVEELGSAPTLTLLSQDSSTAQDLATFIQAQLQENLGADVEIDQQPFESFLDRIDQGDFQFVNQGWIADYNDPSTFMDLFVTDSSFNRSGYSNEQYDELVLGTQETSDNQARAEAFAEAESLLLSEDYGIGMLYFDGVTGLKKPYIERPDPRPFGGFDFVGYEITDG